MSETAPIVILLVEDSPTARIHAQACLKQGLEGEYTLLNADTLAKTLKVLAEHEVNVILLDLNLPDSLGLDTFQQVRGVSSGAAIVIVSGESDERVAVSAVRAGAQDYIVKGPHFTAALLGRTVQFALERNARALIESELRSIRQELTIADAIQQMLYPKMDTQFPEVAVAGRCLPATLNCGDYFDFIPQSDGSLLVVIGDVSGHGIGPAMMMIETRAALRVLAGSEIELGEILNRVNRLLARDMQQRLFVTLFIAHLDPSRRQLRYASAGHPGYLVRPDGSVVTLESDNHPLGITSSEHYETLHSEDYRPGDLLALFTDGISEATCDHMAFLGDQGVLDEIVRQRKLSGEKILDAVFALAEDFNGSALQQDDRTAVIVQTHANHVPAPHRPPPQPPTIQQEDASLSDDHSPTV
ncbi:fused response regulator/phosphatase [Roseimaritima ulvae]|uniref:Phosphoserine phosphatase RsbU n=1 Tax=Roseimaritima ulvae TaxID=980254 RepID=A0A5B9QQC0_9BACT|nr:fused response regulator/phosphatase [Roseimaritima ulvae]QEG41174.1 Phosphoserine phosphatase RsbU [Roseimaritima ulvae]